MIRLTDSPITGWGNDSAVWSNRIRDSSLSDIPVTLSRPRRFYTKGPLKDSSQDLRATFPLQRESDLRPLLATLANFHNILVSSNILKCQNSSL